MVYIVKRECVFDSFSTYTSHVYKLKNLIFIGGALK